MVRHQGVVIGFAMDRDRKIYYTVLNLEKSPGGANTDPVLDANHWSVQPIELAFPEEIGQVGFQAAGVTVIPKEKRQNSEMDRFRSTTARLTDLAPFQVLSDGQYVYLFRQAIDANHSDMVWVGDHSPVVNRTLLVDRFIYDGQALLPKREIRYQRSRKKGLPAGPKDSPGYKDLNKKDFYEPTQELAFIGQISAGRFAVLLMPTAIPNAERWQIFAYNDQTERIDAFSIERDRSGLFNTKGTRYYTCPNHSGVFERHPGPCPVDEHEPLIPVKKESGAAESAISFQGEADVIELIGEDGQSGLFYHQPGELSAITVEAWVKASTPQGNVLSCDGNQYFQLWIEAPDGQLTWTTTDELGNRDDLIGNAILADNTWHFIAATYDQATGLKQLYVDGRLDTESSPHAQRALGRGARRSGIIGGDGGMAQARVFSGVIDEVRLWHRARQQHEIQEDMHHRLIGNEPELTGYWRLDEGRGTRINDQTDQARHGRLNGGEWIKSKAPIGTNPGVQRSSFAFDGRAVTKGLAAQLYYQQEPMATGYQIDIEQPMKRQARVMLAVATAAHDKPDQHHIAALDIGVSRDGTLAQLPDLITWPQNQGPSLPLNEINALLEDIQSLDREAAALESALTHSETDVKQAGERLGLLRWDRVEFYESKIGVSVGKEESLEADFFPDQDADLVEQNLNAVQHSVVKVALGLSTRIHIRDGSGATQTLGVVGPANYYFTQNFRNDDDWRELTDEQGRRVYWGDIYRAIFVGLPENPSEYKIFHDRTVISIEIPKPLQVSRQELQQEFNLVKAELQAKQEQLNQLVGNIDFDDASQVEQLNGELKVPMPLLHIDPHGLTVMGELLTFAWTDQAPLLYESVNGRLSLYFRGPDKQFFAAYYDVRASRSNWELPTESDGHIRLETRAAGTGIDGTRVQVSDDPDDKTRCNVVITHPEAAITEKWHGVPRAHEVFAAVLNGEVEPTYIGNLADALTGEIETIRLQERLRLPLAAGTVLSIGDTRAMVTEAEYAQLSVVVLDGEDDHIDLGSAQALGVMDGDFSIVLRLKLSDDVRIPSTADRVALPLIGHDQSTVPALWAIVHDGAVGFSFSPDTEPVEAMLHLNQWFTLIWRYRRKNSQSDLLINGKPYSIAASDANMASLNDTSRLYIGRAGDQYLKGEIEYIGIWHKSLSPNEVASFQNVVIPADDSTPPPVVRFREYGLLDGVAGFWIFDHKDGVTQIINYGGFFQARSGQVGSLLLGKAGASIHARFLQTINIQPTTFPQTIPPGSRVSVAVYDYATQAMAEPVNQVLEGGSTLLRFDNTHAHGNVINGEVSGQGKSDNQWFADSQGNALYFDGHNKGGQLEMVRLDGGIETLQQFADQDALTLEMWVNPSGSKAWTSPEMATGAEMRLLHYHLGESHFRLGLVEQMANSALVFNGSDTFIQLPEMQIDLSNGLTIESWVYYHRFNHWSRIIDLGVGPNQDRIILANRQTSNELIFKVMDQDITAPILLENTWLHLAASLHPDGSVFLYVNGVEVATKSFSPMSPLTLTRNFIGQSNWDESDKLFNGRMDEVRLWNQGRTRSEIQTTMNCRLNGNESGLIGYWPFSNREVLDKSGHRHDGQIQGRVNMSKSPIPHFYVAGGVGDKHIRSDASSLLPAGRWNHLAMTFQQQFP